MVVIIIIIIIIIKTILFLVRSEGHREPRNEVGFQGLTKHIIRIGTGNLPILSYPTVLLSQQLSTYFTKKQHLCLVGLETI